MRREESEDERSEREGGMELVQGAEQSGAENPPRAAERVVLWREPVSTLLFLDLLTVSLTVCPCRSPHMETASLKWSNTTSAGLLFLRQLCKVILGFNCYSPILLTPPPTLATWSVAFTFTLYKATLGKMGCSFSFLNTLQEDTAIPQVSQLQLQRTNVQFQKGFRMVRAILSTEKATYGISQTSGPNLSLLNPTILNILWTFDAWVNCNKCCMILKVCKCQQSS